MIPSPGLLEKLFNKLTYLNVYITSYYHMNGSGVNEKDSIYAMRLI